MKKINPQSLRQLRKQKGWSQNDLATQTGLGKRRLVELEDCSVQFHDVRDSNFEDLCKALGATDAQLRGEEPITDPLPVNYVTLPSKITTIAQMNYDLISLSYGLSSDQLVQLAPLMFAILVEDSFVWRKEQLELGKQIQELKKQVRESQYDPEPSLHDSSIEEDFREEEAAIADRKVFSRPWWANVKTENGGEEPASDRFTDYISAKVNASEGRIQADLTIGYRNGRNIRDPDTKYAVKFDLLNALTDAEDVQMIAKLRLALMSGAVRLPNLLGGLSDEQLSLLFSDAGASSLGERIGNLLQSDVFSRVDEFTHLFAPEVYGFTDEAEGLRLDSLGFPVRMLQRHHRVAPQSDEQGDGNASA
jgi:transcriptional regulator with XRE-family HTH domain